MLQRSKTSRGKQVYVAVVLHSSKCWCAKVAGCMRVGNGECLSGAAPQLCMSVPLRCHFVLRMFEYTITSGSRGVTSTCASALTLDNCQPHEL